MKNAPVISFFLGHLMYDGRIADTFLRDIETNNCR